MSESRQVPLRPTIIFSNPRTSVLTQLEKAQREINALSSDTELQYNAIFGRPRNDEETAEEVRRNKLYFERFVAIVKKYGVEDEYLKPLIKKRDRLWSELAKVCQEIQAIRA
jgi:hypothetical protein